jgi:hypothetical protein
MVCHGKERRFHNIIRDFIALYVPIDNSLISNYALLDLILRDCMLSDCLFVTPTNLLLPFMAS